MTCTKNFSGSVDGTLVSEILDSMTHPWYISIMKSLKRTLHSLNALLLIVRRPHVHSSDYQFIFVYGQLA
jgi:hypothetical protein